jgi:hypothetical protein
MVTVYGYQEPVYWVSDGIKHLDLAPNLPGEIEVSKI